MARHNLCTNPAMKNNVTGWGGGSTPTQQTGLTGFPNRTTGARYTSGTFLAGPTISVNAGETWTFSIEARSNAFNTNSGTIYMQWQDSSSSSTGYTLTAGVVKRVSITVTVPSGKTSAQLIMDGQNFASSSYDITECLYEQVGTLDTYFDGDSPSATWDGTNGNSASTLDTTVQVSSSDTATGTEATSSLVATTSATETGTGTEATSALTAATSSAETSTGTEATSAESASTSSTDTGSGTDTGSVTASTSSSDTTSTTEAAQVGIPSSDTASGSESAVVGLTSSDTASGSEASIVGLSGTDSAVGTDAQSSLSASLSSGDTGTGSEAHASSAGLSAADTATGSESQALDTGSGTPIASADTATSTQGQSVHASVTGTDTATGIDALSTLRATLTGSETVTATDSASIQILHAVSSADTATGTEGHARSAVPNSRKVHVYPYYIRESQAWAVEQERRRHNQALWMVGETTMFALMWHIEDFQEGLVERCRTCYDSQGAIADVYGQSDQNKCLDCFGTTFDGGFKAIIIRPAIFSDTDEGETFHGRGVIHPNDLAIESTPDFRVRNGDYCFRATGERYYLRVPERITLRTGYGLPTQQDMAIGYNHSNAQVEDPTAVSYLIPPPQDEVNSLLRRASRIPRDWSSFETIRAPLIPTDLQAPDA